MKVEEIPDGAITDPLGFKAGATACGVKQSGKLDLAIIYSDRDCTAAGMFTQNQVAAAPVILDRHVLERNSDRIRGVVANAGNANACTGEKGMMAASEMQLFTAASLGGRPEQFFVLSTGVIGVQLPVEKVKQGITTAAGELSSDNGLLAAEAILTTDKRTKHLAVTVVLPGGTFTIGGVAKGSGMIHPNMATMLAVITTDAAVPAGRLQRMLSRSVDMSFNNISVDGDTSTNDTVLLLANGASDVTIDDEHALAAFAAGLDHVCTELAKMVVLDGEGASKFVEIVVQGAINQDDARAVASTVATSPLVKTALGGSDPNWGRILAAAGRAGVSFDQSKVDLWISNPDDTELGLVQGGLPLEYAEAEAAAIFARSEINIRLDLGQGRAENTIWTCDLSHDYVSINQDYRT